MKKVLYKSHTITFQEKVGSSETAPEHSGGKTLPRAFDTPKEHLEFHLKNLQKMPDVIKGVKVIVKKG